MSNGSQIFSFADPGQHVVARMVDEPVREVLGISSYPAELVVDSPFVSGSLRIFVTLEDLRDWGRCMDDLERGESIVWPPEHRSPRVEISVDEELVVEIIDAPSSQVSVRVPLDIEYEDSIENNRILLNNILNRFS
ncbi:DUF5959 family protein [Nocardiopsis lucentensis]|uniref:DUF5959 family protein n=1 Tax=Nocardiopsis lucentensis TaxID=53441 RepID=UPI001267CCEC|nr:DUF5959 family protein [Nocardiopsis lucentensis]